MRLAKRNRSVKKWLQRVTPTHTRIIENRYLGIFGKLLHDPNLWHLNRRSVAGGVAVGLFVMYLPPIGHTLLAAALAILLRVNLPISLTLIWLCNPLTIPPMFYFAYRLGCWILALTPAGFDAHFWLDWHNWLAIMQPLLLGSLICSLICGALGYLLAQLLWRWRLARQIRRRRARYRTMMGERLSTPSSRRQV